MNKSLSKKITIISFITMIMVVFLHANNLVINLKAGNIKINRGYNSFIQDFFTQGITRVAVPIFFIISGYLFFLNVEGKFSEYRHKIFKRVKTLVIPYLFWSFWGIFLFFVLQSLPLSQNFFTNGFIKDMKTEDFLQVLLLSPLPYQLWFLRDLMLLVLVAPVLFLLIKYLKVYSIVFALIPWFLGYYSTIINSDSPLFFIIGGYLAIFNKLQTLQLKQYSFLLFTTWILLVLTHTILLFNGVSLYNTNLMILNKITILVGIFVIWSVYDNFDIESKSINPLLGYSFFLYVFHEPILTIIKKGLYFLIGNSEHASFIVYLLAPCITIVISLSVGILLKKNLPKIYNIATGGR